MIAPTFDTRDMLPLIGALRGVDAELRRQARGELRSAAAESAAGLVLLLRQAAAAASTPQAVLMAPTIRVKADVLPIVQIGGSRRVGHRRTPAGRLVWGSESGGERFTQPRGGAYWITPTVNAYARTGAARAYQRAVVGVLRRAGVV